MGSDSDSDAAPEAVSLTQSKAGAKERDAALKRADAARARERKERNRKRDESLKKRAEETRKNSAHGKGGGKMKKVQNDGDEEERRLQDRMARAMQEAGEESDASDEEGDWTGLGDSDLHSADSSSSDSEPGPSKPRRITKGHLSIENEDEEGEDDLREMDEEIANNLEDLVEDEEDDDPEEYEAEVQPRPRKKARKLGSEPAEADYLPDHLFTSVLSKPLNTPKGKETKKASSKAHASIATRKKAKRRGHLSSKDLIVGKKTIRTLPTKIATPAVKAAARTVPPPKVRKFTESSLSLKGTTNRRKLGWERRPVNVGSMRSGSLPAAGFVRG